MLHRDGTEYIRDPWRSFSFSVKKNAHDRTRYYLLLVQCQTHDQSILSHPLYHFVLHWKATYSTSNYNNHSNEMYGILTRKKIFQLNLFTSYLWHSSSEVTQKNMGKIDDYITVPKQKKARVVWQMLAFALNDIHSPIHQTVLGECTGVTGHGPKPSILFDGTATASRARCEPLIMVIRTDHIGRLRKRKR